MKMGRRPRDVGEASPLCFFALLPKSAKRGRFAYTALPAAHFDRNKVHAISGTGHYQHLAGFLLFYSFFSSLMACIPIL